MYLLFGKRLLDIILAGIATILLSPFFLFVSVVIKITDPGPIFFSQRRITKGKNHFQILKFRTMKTSAPKDCPTHLLKNPDEFITPIGRFLRKTSLDELPQLFNILAGDMSIVGPRPALWNQFDLIEQRDFYKANDILPGLTGWAQINGRDELTIDIKAKLDGYYVEHCSLMTDLSIIFRTAFAVFLAKGVQEGAQD